MHKRIRKKYFNNVLKKLTENDEVKSIAVDVLTNFIKEEVESSFDAKVYTDDIDMTLKEVVIPEEFPCARKGSKYFFDYASNEGIRLLCVLLPGMNGYLKKFDDLQSWS